MATVLLPATAETMSVVRLSSSCFLLSWSMLCGLSSCQNCGLPLGYHAEVAGCKSVCALEG
jgi:hypothetical protein